LKPGVFSGPVHVQGPEDELSFSMEFDLQIEEGNDPVMNDTLSDIEQDARQILEDGGQDIVDEAQDLVPVRTGFLQAGIYYQVEDVSGLTVGAHAGYASFVEYGTSRMAARPFLEPAINDNQDTIQGALDDMIAQHLSDDMSEDDPELEFDVEMEALGE
jgi:HK97 gp10 family phage protein